MSPRDAFITDRNVACLSVGIWMILMLIAVSASSENVANISCGETVSGIYNGTDFRYDFSTSNERINYHFDSCESYPDTKLQVYRADTNTLLEENNDNIGICGWKWSSYLAFSYDPSILRGVPLYLVLTRNSSNSWFNRSDFYIELNCERVISCGETVTAELSNGTQHRYDLITTNETAVYSLNACQSEFDSFLEVVETHHDVDKESIVAENDDNAYGECADAHASYLSFNPDPATFADASLYVAIRAPDTTSFGNYSLTLSCDEYQYETISCGETVNGFIANGTTVHRYQFLPLGSPAMYYFDACNSDWFDAVVSIYRGQIASNHSIASTDRNGGLCDYEWSPYLVLDSAAVYLAGASLYVTMSGYWASSRGNYSLTLDCDPYSKLTTQELQCGEWVFGGSYQIQPARYDFTINDTADAVYAFTAWSYAGWSAVLRLFRADNDTQIGNGYHNLVFEYDASTYQATSSFYVLVTARDGFVTMGWLNNATYWLRMTCESRGDLSEYPRGPLPNEYFQALTVSSLWFGSAEFSNYACENYGVYNKISPDYPVRFYRFNLTASLKSTYKSQIAVVVKHTSEWGYWQLNMSDSLDVDTVLYLLYERDGQLNLIDYNDDHYDDEGNYDTNSFLDLTDLRAGEYVLGVGAYSQKVGLYTLTTECITYGFPLASYPEQFDPANNVKTELHCNQVTTVNITEKNFVLYFKLDWTETTYAPITVGFCSNMVNHSDVYSAYQEYVYAIKPALTSYAIMNYDQLAALSDLTYQTYPHYYDEYDDELMSPDEMYPYLQGTPCYDYYDEYDRTYRAGILSFDITTALQASDRYVVYQFDFDEFNYWEEVNTITKTLHVVANCADPPTPSPTEGPTFSPSADPTSHPSANPTPSPTPAYSFPVVEDEFTVPETGDESVFLSCSQTKHSQENTETELVSYFRFTKTSNDVSPSYISTCFSDEDAVYNYVTYKTILYILDTHGHLMSHKSECISYPCTCEQSQMEISSLSDGDYVVAIQGFQNQIGNFSVSMHCSELPPKVSQATVMGLVFGLSGAVFAAFAIYYVYKWKEYHEGADQELPRSHSARAHDSASASHGGRIAMTKIRPKHHTARSQSDAGLPNSGDAGEDEDEDDEKMQPILEELHDDEALHLHRFFEEHGLDDFYDQRKLFSFGITSLRALCEINVNELREIRVQTKSEKKRFTRAIRRLELRLFLEEDEKLAQYYAKFIEYGVYSLAALAKMQQCQLHNMGIVDEDHQEKILEAISERQLDVNPGDPRRIDSDNSVYDQLVKNEDVIQRVIAHSIQCCEDQNGFDIYQVLAIRYYDEESRKVRPSRPFSKFGVGMEVISFPPFVTTWIVALITGLAQTVGITVVVYKLLNEYFHDGEFSDICDMQADRWTAVWSLRLLSFLFSLIVTFYVSTVMSSIDHSGLYEIINTLKLEHINRINENNDGIVLWLLYAGQGINYYVVFLAVIGSYFIVFATNNVDPDDSGYQDYSEAGLNMILNAVALFFMLELDDVMVAEQDYGDCKAYLEDYLQHKNKKTK